MTFSRVPVDDTILRLEPGPPRLLGSRCGACGARAFAVQSGCGRCGSADLETVELPPRGTLWTWTSQDFPPKDPPYLGPVGENFAPYYVGFVDVGGGLCVEARLAGFGGRAPEIGEELAFTTVTLRTDTDGSEVVIPAFEPAGSASTGSDSAGSASAGSASAAGGGNA